MSNFHNLIAETRLLLDEALSARDKAALKKDGVYWRTTGAGHKIGLGKNGNIKKGNPHHLAGMAKAIHVQAETLGAEIGNEFAAYTVGEVKKAAGEAQKAAKAGDAKKAARHANKAQAGMRRLQTQRKSHLVVFSEKAIKATPGKKMKALAKELSNRQDVLSWMTRDVAKYPEKEYEKVQKEIETLQTKAIALAKKSGSL